MSMRFMIPPPETEPKETTSVFSSRPFLVNAAFPSFPDILSLPEDDDDREKAERTETKRKKPMRKEKITFIYHIKVKNPRKLSKSG